ncbi:MmpS family transport accessory protein [Micromonospora musae]|uniref:MmpS family transport accessory protein n=1 Tax=Micromonospora musae TaxID=1894970 RepID=UPI0033E616F9
MSDGPPPSDPSPSDPQPEPGPWAPLDPASAGETTARPDLWLATTPIHPPAPTADATSAPIVDLGGGVAYPVTGDARPGARRGRRLVGALLAVALLLGGGVALGARLSDPPADHAQADPFADDLSAEGGEGDTATDGGDGDTATDSGDGDTATDATSVPTPSASPATTPSGSPGLISVVYEVTGRGRADILYYDANGVPVWLDARSLPWRRSIRTDHRDQVVLQASRIAGTGDTLTCSVRVDGGAPITEKVGVAGSRASCSGGAAG